ncbi:ABC-type oligopeptide transport system, periplasmic component [Thermaerobacter subterraneus DSM 13965]|uniref:ABC-type oligopeptide transport system, periplasmic component n=1 Tax=Thermaerobacter subterraneus DSM 13965 TaxID=867903 RepID=K6Q2H4_9FIRM|nr:ABC-type oligopeptide transport system, periplasmic component [Thermaerobacter subterraneus DSM 13965]
MRTPGRKSPDGERRGGTVNHGAWHRTVLRRIRRAGGAVLAGVVLVALILGGCGSPGSGGSGGEEQVLNDNIGSEPPTLDPALMTDLTSFQIVNSVMEGLTRIGPNGVEPGMAAEWGVSDDQMTYTFHLRDAVWQNGDPVTAEDFVYAWLRVLNPETGAPYAYQLYYIKNAEAYNSGEITDPSQVGVKALDEKTLQVTLESPTPYFLSLTAFPTLMPVHKATVESNPDWAGEAATYVGNGPFKIAEWVHDSHIDLVKSDTYWDKDTVRLEKMHIVMVNEGATAETMFANGELDSNGSLNPQDIPQLLASGEAKTSPIISVTSIYFNTRKAPFDDPRVRKAFTLALDRKAIVEQILKGGQKPALAFVPFGIPNPVTNQDFREEGGDYFQDADVETARRLLAEAGYPDGQGFPKVTYLYNDNDTNRALAEAYQQMWKQNLGVQVELQSMEWKVFLAAQKQGDYDLSRGNWVGDYLDPMTFLDLWVTGGGNNRVGWSNAQYDRLIEEAKATGDQQVRFQNMHEAEKILMDEMPIGPIFFGVNVYQEKPYVKGVFRTALGTTDYKWAYIEGKGQ